MYGYISDEQEKYALIAALIYQRFIIFAEPVINILHLHSLAERNGKI